MSPRRREQVAPGQSLAPPAGEHGGDGERLAARLGVHPDAILDLSASLNPVPPPVGARAARRLDALLRYPDEEEATAALAAAMRMEPERVVLTNGGAEAIAIVAAEVGTGWVEEPEFSLYARHLPVLDRDAGRWRSNPHNPTGELAAWDERARVWDEAFWPLATGTWTRGDAERGSVVVGSLTKLFACPGLRMGYVLAPNPSFADRLRRRRPAWSVNGLVCALLPGLLTETDLQGWASQTRTLRDGLCDLLIDSGFKPQVADAPWVLVPAAADLRERLARHGILVRDCTSFGLRDTVRIGVPDYSGLDRLATALEG